MTPEIADKVADEKFAVSVRDYREPPDYIETRKGSIGWYCGNCKRWHGPDIATCLSAPAGGSLRERIKEVHNG